jgi:hypothetical protein
MISTEIYIENQRLDLSKDLSTEFTYNIDDIKEFASRETNFSKTIVLPGNAVNNKLFGHIFEFGSANFFDDNQPNVGYNFNASKAASCLIFMDKVQIFKGILRILEIVIDNGMIEYECAVFGELGGFINELGNKKIEELNFSAYDHNWTSANIQASWDVSGATAGSRGVNNSLAYGSGYYYPLIDYGKVSSNNKHDWDVQSYRPALFVREYIDKIILNTGYTYESAFFNTAVFRRLVIPHNQKTLTKTTSNFNVATRTTNLQILGTSLVTFPTVTGSGLVVTSSNSKFTYPFDKSSNLKIDYSFSGESTSGTFYILRNSISVFEYNFTEGFGIAGVFELLINKNDFIQFRITNTAENKDDNPVTLNEAEVSFFSDALQNAVVAFNDSLIMADVIPKGIFQRDFFASIIKMFNMYVVEDTNRPKHLIIKPYIEYYDFDGQSLLAINDFNDLLFVNDTDYLLLNDATLDYLDWSYKVDRSKPMKLKPMSELNGRYFEFKYKSDTDYYNEQYQKKYNESYGSRIEDSGYDFAKEKQTAEIIFAPSALVGYQGEDKLFSTILKLNNGVEDNTDHVIRIMQAKKVTGVTSYLLKNGGSTVSTLTTYGYAGHLDDPSNPNADLNYGVPQELFFSLDVDYPNANLFNAYWSEYVAEITDKDSKLLSAFIYLKTKDIYSLDFAKLIYIDGALWRLNKIADYNPMDIGITKAEFLKVIDTSYA